MNLAASLGRREREELERALERISAGDTRVSLNHLVSNWVTFVTAVERGYKASIYEYENDLSIRDRLDQLFRLASPKLRSKLSQMIEPIDERFEHATQMIKEPLVPEKDSAAWWWWRVPQVSGEELDRDLRAEGNIT